eukprot:7631273-Pyramimonas_sp.AAC.1
MAGESGQSSGGSPQVYVWSKSTYAKESSFQSIPARLSVTAIIPIICCSWSCDAAQSVALSAHKKWCTRAPSAPSPSSRTPYPKVSQV